MCNFCKRADTSDKICESCQSETFCCEEPSALCPHCRNVAQLLEGIPPHWDSAPPCDRHCLTTQGWVDYTSALVADLRRLSSEQIEQNIEQLSSGITSVLLYRSHVASFQNLQFTPTSVIRQENPYDKDRPEVYYRSQTLAHPQFDLLEDLWADPDSKEMPPLNPQVVTLLRNTGPEGTVLQRQLARIKVHEQATIVTEKADEQRTSDVPFAHAGLRRTNADAVQIAVRRLLPREGGLDHLTSLIQSRTPPSAAGKVEIKAVRFAALEILLDQCFDAISALFTDESPVANVSYVTRKLESTKARADAFLAPLPALQNFTIRRQADNPLITMEVNNPKSLETSLFKALVGGLRIYIASRVYQQLTKASYPFGLNLRQSFGFMDTTLANTEPSIRISVGTEPADYFTVLATVLTTVDKELTSYFEKTANLVAALHPLFSLGRPGSLFTTLTNYLALANPCESFAAFIQLVETEITGSKRSKEDELAMMRELEARLAEKSSVAPAPSEREPLGTLAVLDILHDVLLIASNVVADVMLKHQIFGDGPFRDTAFAITKRMACTLQTVADLTKPLTDPWKKDPCQKPEDLEIPKLQRFHICVDLRNAAEEISESCLILQAIAGWNSRDRDELPAHLSQLKEDLRKEREDTNDQMRTTLQEVRSLAAQAKGDNTGLARDRLGPLTQKLCHELKASRELWFWKTRVTPPTNKGKKPIVPLDQRLVMDLEAAEVWFQQDVMRLLQVSDLPVAVLRTDSGEQAFAVVSAALIAEKEKPLSIYTPTSIYFEVPDFFSEYTPRSNAANKGNTWDVLFLDPRPYLNEVKDDIETFSFDAIWSRVRNRRAIKGKNKAGLLSIVIDVTNIDYTEVLPFLSDITEQLSSERVRIILVSSSLKHEEMGLDKYQAGRIMIIGKPLAALSASFSSNTLVNEMLKRLTELRNVDDEAFREFVKECQDMSQPAPDQAGCALQGRPGGPKKRPLNQPDSEKGKPDEPLPKKAQPASSNYVHYAHHHVQPEKKQLIALAESLTRKQYYPISGSGMNCYIRSLITWVALAHTDKIRQHEIEPAVSQVAEMLRVRGLRADRDLIDAGGEDGLEVRAQIEDFFQVGTLRLTILQWDTRSPSTDPVLARYDACDGETPVTLLYTPSHFDLLYG